MIVCGPGVLGLSPGPHTREARPLSYISDPGEQVDAEQMFTGYLSPINGPDSKLAACHLRSALITASLSKLIH